MLHTGLITRGEFLGQVCGMIWLGLERGSTCYSRNLLLFLDNYF